MSNYKSFALHDYINKHKVFNTHTHHFPDAFFENFNLGSLINQGYVNWQNDYFDDVSFNRQHFLDKVRYKSYFVWLEKALKIIYKFDDSLSADNCSY